MSLIPNRICLFLVALLFITSFCWSNEIDLDKNELLFEKMFGDEYKKVLATPIKTDDEKFALDLIVNAEAIKSNADLQTYIIFRAADILSSSDKNKRKARDLFVETKPSMPLYQRKEIDIKVFDLQKSILNNTPASNKMQYAEEVDFFVSQAQTLTSIYLQDSDYTNALNTLKETLRFARFVDKDAVNEINKTISNIQKEANRFSQIQVLLKRLEQEPKDEKTNLEIAEYYLLERNNLFKAWPYLNNLNDEIYSHFFHLITKCITDEQKLTADGLSSEIASLLIHHPEFTVGWLASKDVVDPEEVIKNQKKLLESKKNLQIDKIIKVIQNTVSQHGEIQDVPYKTYLSLAELFDSMLTAVQKNNKTSAENIKIFKERLTVNKFIALMKANIKIQKATVEDVDKLKLELELGKTKIALKDLKIEELTVTISTPFLFQQDDLWFDRISVNSEGLYSFEPNSWLQFNKDFEIIINKTPFDMKDKTALFVEKGALVFNENKSYFLKSKKRNWSQYTEVSFELLKDYDPMRQGLDFFILFKPDQMGHKTIFGVHYHFFLRGGWFGVMRDGEGWEQFCASKLQRKINPDNDRFSFWKTDEKAKFSVIIKDKKFEITINDETIVTSSLAELSSDKNFPNTPIQIYFARRGGPVNPAPVKIDNLYIGPPRAIKKK